MVTLIVTLMVALMVQGYYNGYRYENGIKIGELVIQPVGNCVYIRLGIY